MHTEAHDAVHVETTTEVRHLPVPLSHDRKFELGEELAEHTSEKLRLEKLKKEIADNQTKAIKAREKEIRRVAEAITQGVEMQPVDCRITKDLDRNTQTVIRLDTMEIVSERALVPAEHADVDGG